jgi:glycosyltransferase involved in cell wall biosynthesis
MQKLAESASAPVRRPVAALPVSAIIAVRNEARNLPRCLESLREIGEAYVVDSQSTDATVEIARSFGVKVVQFEYRGGWPKKRQWAMESLPLAYPWILLLDADESLTPELTEEIRFAIQDSRYDGYYLALSTYFLGRQLRHGDVRLWKLSLFRRGKGQYECRLKDQDASMADMEVHEHVVVEGATARLRNPVIHYNVESLSRYIRKHDAYSNWEAKVWLDGNAGPDALSASLTGTQAQRRRWLRHKFFAFPGSPLVFFLYRYVFRLGFLDGIPGFIYSCFQGIQFFHIKAKIYELQQRSGD